MLAGHCNAPIIFMLFPRRLIVSRCVALSRYKSTIGPFDLFKLRRSILLPLARARATEPCPATNFANWKKHFFYILFGLLRKRSLWACFGTIVTNLGFTGHAPARNYCLDLARTHEAPEYRAPFLILDFIIVVISLLWYNYSIVSCAYFSFALAL